MASSIAIKRKNIDLPVETLQKLSLLAVAQGKSLKGYIESLLISKADSVSIEIKENPSPSGDVWFSNPENIASLEKGILEMKSGKDKTYTIDEIKSSRGI